MRPAQRALAAVALGSIVKLALALTTYGTNDVRFWGQSAVFVAEHGSVALYRVEPEFSQPPMVAAILGGVGAWVARHPDDFPLGFRLSGIIADLGSAWLVWGLARKACGETVAARAVALFALNPVAVLVTGFHGNSDPVLMMLVLAALAARLLRGSAGLAGLTLGLAANVKLSATLAVPALLVVGCRSARERAGFLAGFAAVVAAGFAYHLAVCPEAVASHVLAYRSVPGVWGLGWLLASPRLALPASFLDLFPSLARPALFVPIAWAAWRLARVPAPGVLPDPAARDRALLRATGLAFLVFLVLTPGFGVQYLGWLAAPGVFLATAGYLAFALLGGVFLFAVYTTWCGGVPWDYADSTRFDPSLGFGLLGDLGYVLWLALLAWAAWELSRVAAAARLTRSAPPSRTGCAGRTDRCGCCGRGRGGGSRSWRRSRSPRSCP